MPLPIARTLSAMQSENGPTVPPIIAQNHRNCMKEGERKAGYTLYILNIPAVAIGSDTNPLCIHHVREDVQPGRWRRVTTRPSSRLAV